MRDTLFTLLLGGLACVFSALPATAQKVKVKPTPAMRVEVEAAPQEPAAPRAPRPARAPVPAAEASDDSDVMRQTMAAVSNVVVRLELKSGDIEVTGWDKEEVAVEAESSGRVALERADFGDEKTPAAQIEIYVKRRAGRDDFAHADEDCEWAGNSVGRMTLNVPRGATLYLKTLNGEVQVEDVAELNAESMNGDMQAGKISRYANCFSANGDLSINDVKGRVTARVLSGDLTIVKAQPLAAGDFLKAIAVSGDVFLDKVAHANVESSSVSGEVLYQGIIARGGNYSFKTTSGDIILLIPADSSFRLNAKVAYGDISTDFALRSEDGQNGDELKQGKLVGVHGKGEASLALTSFSGAIALRKK